MSILSESLRKSSTNRHEKSREELSGEGVCPLNIPIVCVSRKEIINLHHGLDVPTADIIPKSLHVP